MKGKSVMRRFALAGALLLSAFVARAEDLTEQHVFVCGYRLTESGSFNSKFTTLPGLSAALTKEGPGCVYREDVQDAEFLNNNVIVAKVPFGYKVGYWIRSYGKDQFIRTKGEKIEGSDGALKLTVPFDGKDGSINIGLVILYDNDRTLTVGKSPFGAGKVTVKSGDEEVGVVSDKAKRDFSCQKGDQFRLTAIPDADANTGYDHSTFRRWNDGSTSYERTITVDTNATYVAEFVPNSWTVTFDANGGEVFPTSKVVTCDATYGWLPTPTRTGHRFLDWFIDRPDGEGVNANARVGAIGDHTLLAAWEADRLTVGWARTGDGNGEVSGAGSYPYGEKAKLQALPFEGSRFVCWTDGETRNPRFVTVVSNALYVAEFAVKTYEVTFAYRDASGRPKTSEPQIVSHGKAAVPPSEDEYDRWAEHVFTNWSTEEYKAVTRDLKVEAIYDAQTYDVSFAYHDRAGNCVTTMPQHVVSGDAAKPPSDSVVNNWTGMSFTGWQPDYNVIGSNCVIEALYVKKEYKVLYSYCDGTGKEVQHAETVKHGDKVPFSYVDGVAKQWQGHEFKYWTLDGKRITGDVVATRDMIISAVYEGYAKIVFEPNGGVGEMPPQVFTNYSGEVTLSSNVFVRTGYTFVEWKDQDGKPHQDRGSVTVAVGKNLTLTAQWDPIKYVVQYDKNNERITTWEYEDQEFDYDVENALRDGAMLYGPPEYNLLGWSRDKDAGTPEYERKARVKNLTNEEAVVTLYGIWEKNPTLTCKVADGCPGTGTVSGGTNCVSGTTVMIRAVPDEGSVFVKWNDGDTNPEREVTVTEDVTYSAWFDVAKFDVSFVYKNAAGQDVTNGPQKIEYKQSATEPDETMRNQWTGHKFARWSTDDWREVKSNLVVVANYTSLCYSVTCAVTGKGSVNGTGTYEWMTEVELEASPDEDEGYVFSKWEDDETVSATRTVCVTQDLNYAVVFTQKVYDVTFIYRDKDGNVVRTVQSVSHGDDAVPPAEEVYNSWSGHTFSKWDRSYEKVTSSIKVTALYDSYFTIVYKPNGGEGSDTSISYSPDDGTSVFAGSSTFAKIGYEFVKWAESTESGATTHEAGGPFPEGFAKPNVTTNLFATWRPIEYTLTFNLNGGTGTTPSDICAKYDEEVKLPGGTEFSKEGFNFHCWTNDVKKGEQYLAGGSYSNFTATAGDTVTLYALWEAKPTYSIVYHVNGDGVYHTQTLLVDSGDAKFDVTQPSAPEGYEFVGWTNAVTVGSVSAGTVFNSGDDIPADFKQENEAVHLYVKWKVADSPLKKALGLSGTDVEVSIDGDQESWTVGGDESNRYVQRVKGALDGKLKLEIPENGTLSVEVMCKNMTRMSQPVVGILNDDTPEGWEIRFTAERNDEEFKPWLTNQPLNKNDVIVFSWDSAVGGPFCIRMTWTPSKGEE